MNVLTAMLPIPRGFRQASEKSLIDSLEGMAIWEYDSLDCSQTVVQLCGGLMNVYTNQTNVLEGSTAVIDWSYDKRCFVSAG
jgi:hypothetical protein